MSNDPQDIVETGAHPKFVDIDIEKKDGEGNFGFDKGEDASSDNDDEDMPKHDNLKR